MSNTREKKLPESWTRTTIEEIAISLQYGYTASAISNKEGVRFLRITDIQDGKVDWRAVPSCEISGSDIEKYKLKDGDLVFVRTGATTGKSYIIKNCPEAVFASYLIRLSVSERINPGFVYAFFQSNQYWHQIERGKRGIGQPNVNAQILGSIDLPIAPFNEQRRIVAEIEKQFARLDEAVDALQRVADDLKQYRASVLKAACEGRLVPTEAELAQSEGHEYEPASALLQCILAERRAKWEADQLERIRAQGKEPKDDQWKAKYIEPQEPQISNLSELPDSWIWASVEQVGDVQLGRQRAPKHHRGMNLRKYLRVANVFEDRIDLSDVMEMNFEPNEFINYKLEYGDILLNEGQSLELVGRPAMFRGELKDACFQNTLVRFRSALSLNRDFALIVFRAFLHMGRFKQVARWTVNIAHLGADRFAQMGFPLPPLAEQKRIVDEVEKRLRIADELEEFVAATLDRAEELRRAILKRAFEGRLVPQDPNDESAVILLERIAAERQLRKEEAMKEKPTKTPRRSSRTEKEHVPSLVAKQKQSSSYLLPVFDSYGELLIDDLFTLADYLFEDDDKDVEDFFAALTAGLMSGELEYQRESEQIWVRRRAQ